MRIAWFFRKIGRRTFLEKMGWNKENLRVWYVKKLIKSVVLHYLWGIDTLNSAFIFSLLCNKFYITYEELTRICNVLSPCTYDVLHYLWGIDTILVRILLMSSLTRFTLPMRNWHTLRVYTTSVNWLWFYITYEELTQVISSHRYVVLVRNVLHYLWGIDTLSSIHD